MFYYYLGDTKYGPIDQKAIEHLIRTRVITEDILVQKEGWKTAKRAAVAFKDVFATLPPPAVELPSEQKPSEANRHEKFIRETLTRGCSWLGCFTLFFIFMILGAIGGILQGDSTGGIIFSILFVAALSAVAPLIWKWDEIRRLTQEKKQFAENRKKLEQWRDTLQEASKKISRANDAEVAKRADALAERYLSENVEWIATKLTSSNYPLSKDRLMTAVKSVRAIGFTITDDYAEKLLADLKTQYDSVLRREAEREEQARIKEQMREEAKIQRELQALQEKQKQSEREKAALERAIQEALAAAKGEHSQELATLQQQLADKQAELDAGQRTLSNAEKGIKAGNVYVISNIGSFGEDVFKIGMTRRLDPLDRVRELGDASVPFEFDVHAVLYSEDAPALEHALHQHFVRNQMNKVNPRKEFFRVSLADIQREVETRGIQAQWTITAAAQSYRETLRIEEQMQANPDATRAWEAHQIDIPPQDIALRAENSG
jgi:hypothetical protein